ncbi:MAG: DNA polymerase III subunit delta [Candidatus Omnitrophica bacterium]|nr:DNA polymerase III subunit delta [Candidatus Omnitrophota bacterium]
MPAKIFPAYLFLGEEDFLKEEEISRLKSKFLSGVSLELNYSVFYAKEKNFNIKEMMGTMNTTPFLSKKRLVVLKDADSMQASFKESVISYLQNPRESTIFVIESPSLVIKGGFLLKASGLANLSYFRRLTDSGISAWLVKKAELSGKKIASDAINEIKESLAGELRVLNSGMDNIILYIGNRPVITKSDVEKVIGVNPSHTAFDLMNTIERKDAARALRIFSALKKDKKRETELLGLLAWNARMLLRVKELMRIKNKTEICRDLSLSPGRFDKIAAHAARFKKKDILALLKEILSADLDIKSGTPPRDAIERLIVKMCAV